MKKLCLLISLFIITTALYSQNKFQHEIICPCLLEFKFPSAFYNGNKLSVGGVYGGVPILRFQSLKINDNQLTCIYSKEFANTGLYSNDPGFGFIFNNDIPATLSLTLITDFLDKWIIDKKNLKLKINKKGYVISPVCFPEKAEDGYYYGWNGAFYSEKYGGDAITLKRTFEGEARENSNKNGIIISTTKTGLYTPLENTEQIIKTKRPQKKSKTRSKIE